jgi:hypothetical protein
MKVTGVRTIRLPEHPQMLGMQVLTDEGVTGLGEICLGRRRSRPTCTRPSGPT